jgi:hypothetical protein
MMNLTQDFHFFHKLNLRYQAELGFLKDEIMFLKGFLKSNFPAMFSELAVSRVQLLNDRLVELKRLQENVLSATALHQTNLSIKDIDFLKIENQRIGEDIKDLNTRFKHLKKEIFAFYKDSTERNINPISTELQLS